MPSVMTWRAERHAVGRFIAQGRVFRPRLQVVRVEFATRLRAAVSASPIVALHDRRSKRLVKRIGIVGAAGRPRSAPPVGMRGADQVIVARRLNTSLPQTVPDCGAVLAGEWPISQSICNLRPLFGRQYPASGGRLAHPSGRDARTRLCTLGWIVGEVSSDRSARPGTELKAPPSIGAPALIAGSFLDSRHPTDISGKAA